MKALQTKTTKLFNYFVLCFNRRKASGLCLWIQVLTTMLKNCFFLRLENMFLYFQSGLFQLPSTSWTNAVLQIHSPSININTFTNWCIISLQCSKYPAQSPHNQIFGKKKILRLTSPFTFHHEFWSLCRNHWHFTSPKSLGLKDNVCCIPWNISTCLQWFGIKTTSDNDTVFSHLIKVKRPWYY